MAPETEPRPFEPRLGRFDLVFAAGAKQRDPHGRRRPGGAGAVRRRGISKFDLVDALAPQPAPAVRRRSSRGPLQSAFLPESGVVGALGAQSPAGIRQPAPLQSIFAPHLRLFGAADPRIVRDLPRSWTTRGSTSTRSHPAAIDMTYTRLADVYLGDVSSQVYEFLREPRPCLSQPSRPRVALGRELSSLDLPAGDRRPG